MFATQAALEETQQQQLLMQDEQQYRSPVRTQSPDRVKHISPQRFRALQEAMQDQHAEMAELRGTLHRKDTELDLMHAEIAKFRGAAYQTDTELDALHRSDHLLPTTCSYAMGN